MVQGSIFKCPRSKVDGWMSLPMRYADVASSSSFVGASGEPLSSSHNRSSVAFRAANVGLVAQLYVPVLTGPSRRASGHRYVLCSFLGSCRVLCQPQAYRATFCLAPPEVKPSH